MDGAGGKNQASHLRLLKLGSFMTSGTPTLNSVTKFPQCMILCFRKQHGSRSMWVVTCVAGAKIRMGTIDKAITLCCVTVSRDGQTISLSNKV